VAAVVDPSLPEQGRPMCHWHPKGCDRVAAVDVLQFHDGTTLAPKHFAFCGEHADNFERSCDLLIDRPRIVRLDITEAADSGEVEA
jgi:hypothetical protein